MKVHIDFETRSELDLKKVGAWAYSAHASTEILCEAWALDDGEVQGGVHGLRELAEDPDVIFCAHNAYFEQCIWKNIRVKRYRFPEIPVNRWRCTAAKAAFMSLPRSLGKVAEALNLLDRKDEDGHKIMMSLCRPRSRGRGFWEYEDRPGDFEKLYEYCRTDVEVERAVDRALPDLSEKEQKIWALDQKINLRGMSVDVPAIKQMMKFIDRTTEDLKSEFQEVTNYRVSSPSQVKVFREWLLSQGLDLPNLQASTVDKVLSQDDISDVARTTLTIRRALSKISTSKYKALLSRVDLRDNRVRGVLLYAAAHTNRWGGRGFQPQNLPRGTVNSDGAIMHAMLDDYEWFKGLYPKTMEAYSSCIRGMIVATK